MKKFIFMIITLFFIFGCLEKDIPKVNRIELTSDKSEIMADGIDTVIFTTKYYDIDNNFLDTAYVHLYRGDTKFEEYKFSTTEPGTYIFKDKYSDVESLELFITAKEVPYFLELTIDKNQIFSNNTDFASLSPILKNENEEIINNTGYNVEYYIEDTMYDSDQFKTSSEGVYKIEARLGELISNQVTVTAVKEEMVPSSILLNIDKSILISDGQDSLTLTATVKDQYGAIMTGQVIKYYVNNELISGNIFKTAKPGTYILKAKSGNLISNTYTIIAQDTVVKRIELTVNKDIFIVTEDKADGIILSTKVFDQDDIEMSDVSVEYYNNTTVLESNFFSSNTAGFYNLKAKYLDVTSNVIQVEGKEGAIYSNYEFKYGHDNIVSTVAYSSISNVLVSGSWDKTIKIWSYPDLELLQTLDENPDGIECLEISPDGTKIIAGLRDGKIKVWSCPEGEFIEQINNAHVGIINSILITSDNKTFITGGIDSKIKTWQLGSDIPQYEINNLSEIEVLTFSADQKQIISGDREGKIKLWNTMNGSLMNTFNGPVTKNWINTLALSPSGNRMAVGSLSQISILNFETGLYDEAIGDLKDGEKVGALVFNTLGTKIISGDEITGIIKIWDVNSGDPEFVISGAQETINDLVYIGDTLISVSNDRAIKIWNYTMNNTDSLELRSTISKHIGAINYLGLNEDNSKFVSSGADGTIKIWNVENNSLLSDFHIFDGTGTEVTVARLNDDDTRLLVGTEEGRFEVYDIATKKRLFTKVVSDHKVTDIQVTKADELGKTYAIIGSFNGDLKLINLSDYTISMEFLRTHDLMINNIDLSPDQISYLTVGGEEDKKIKFYDINSTGARVMESTNEIVEARYDNTGGYIVVADKTGFLYNVNSGSANVSDGSSVDTGKKISCMKVNSNGDKIVIGTENGEVEIYSFPNLEKLSETIDVYLSEAESENREVLDIEIDIEGTMIITANKNGRINIITEWE